MLMSRIKAGVNLLLGILFAILVHYFLYRFSLPAKAFIYVAF
jgi:hypothetical protein